MNPQKFIVAVSGGVDSVVMLHMLKSRQSNRVSYIVAHFDHGIRKDSHEDMQFVRDLAKAYDFNFVSDKGKLGPNASEAGARDARYTFLRNVKDTFKAEKIITAHHKDDLLETMVLNIMRGTGPRGLYPMQNQTDILRPLLGKRKKELLAYAKEHSLFWREDESNQNDKYLRNYIRMNIMPKLEPAYNELLTINDKVGNLYLDIDMRISGILYGQRTIYRPKFVYYSFIVQREIIRAWLIKAGVQDLDKKLIERVTIAAKTLPIGKKIDINENYWLSSEKQNVYLNPKKSNPH